MTAVNFKPDYLFTARGIVPVQKLLQTSKIYYWSILTITITITINIAIVLFITFAKKKIGLGCCYLIGMLHVWICFIILGITTLCNLSISRNKQY